MEDLRHWDLHIELSMREASCLAGGIDPARTNLTHAEQARVQVIQAALEQAVASAFEFFKMDVSRGEETGRDHLRLGNWLYCDQLNEFAGNWRRTGALPSKDDVSEAMASPVFFQSELARWFDQSAFASKYLFDSTSAEKTPVSESKKKKWVETMRDPTHQKRLMELVEDQKRNPYAHSQLPYWLSLDLWEREEGLQILAGMEPGTIERSLTSGEWIDGQPFKEHASFKLIDPVEACPRGDWKYDGASYQSYLQAAEHKRAVLSDVQRICEGLTHRLERSAVGLGEAVALKYRPVQFLAWARSIGFEPVWLKWARENRLLPLEVEPMSEPYFDADSPDYPDLLHIAVRAWEHARKATGGTPKQRVLKYLSDRYPRLPQGSRDAIAQVVNWQRLGGRPSARQKSGG